jgi:hypothetical protein
MIWLVIIVVASFTLELCLCGSSFLNHALFLLATAIFIQQMSHANVKCWARGGWLARYIGESWYGVHFSATSQKQLQEIDQFGRAAYMFCCEPHNAACLHMVFGFAAHGGRLPERLASQLCVMAHKCYLALPFINVIYEAYGVVPNFQFVLERCLKRGTSVALCPSGIPGKIDAVLPRPPGTPTNVVRIIRRRRDKLGFLSMATRHQVSLVPVLSVNEHNAFATTGAWAGWLVYGRRLLLPFTSSLELRVGAPLSTAFYVHNNQASMEALADRYYQEVVELGKPDYVVELHDSPSS